MNRRDTLRAYNRPFTELGVCKLHGLVGRSENLETTRAVHRMGPGTLRNRGQYEAYTLQKGSSMGTGDLKNLKPFCKAKAVQGSMVEVRSNWHLKYALVWKGDENPDGFHGLCKTDLMMGVLT